MGNLKKVIGSLVVLGLIVGGVGVLQVMGEKSGGTKSIEQGVKSNERLKPKIQQGLKPNERLKSKLQQVGTPTVQQLLDKVEANYHKIQDLKADYTVKVRLTGESETVTIVKQILGLIGDLITIKLKFYFKAPDKFKHVPPNEALTTIIKDNINYERMGTGWGYKVTKDTPVGNYKLPWYTLLDPDRFDFYWRLDEIITKFDSRVISHPTTDVWVIEAVPKASNPEDDYNYPNPYEKEEIFVDYNKGVITKIDVYCDYTDFDPDVPNGIRLICRSEFKNFQLVNNTWIPTNFILTKFPIPKFRPEQTTEEITLNNIQLNTGIPDSEFEF